MTSELCLPIKHQPMAHRGLYYLQDFPSGKLYQYLVDTDGKIDHHLREHIPLTRLGSQDAVEGWLWDSATRLYTKRLHYHKTYEDAMWRDGEE